jgi:hypothetical protein
MKTTEETHTDDALEALSICSSSGDQEFSSLEERDEVKEVYKLSAKDTLRVQIWRLAATSVLLLTATAVTYATYRFLKEAEKKSFETAVR